MKNPLSSHLYGENTEVVDSVTSFFVASSCALSSAEKKKGESVSWIRRMHAWCG